MNTLIGIGVSLFVGLTTALILRKLDKMEKKQSEKEMERNEREELTLESLNALFHITKELVDCTLYGKPPNGEMEDAYQYKQNVKHKLDDYMRKKAAR